MSPSIRVDEEVYEALKAQAEPFTDTPNSVLRRILGLEQVDALAPVKLVANPSISRGEKRGTPPRKSRRRARRNSPLRAAAGSLLPVDDYFVPMLAVLLERGGQAPAREVIEAVGRKLADKLTGADTEAIASGEIRWRNRVQFARLRLVEQGLVAKNSSRGVWELTDTGRARAAEGA